MFSFRVGVETDKSIKAHGFNCKHKTANGMTDKMLKNAFTLDAR